MNQDESLRTHLAKTLDWEDAHARFDAAIQDVQPADRGIQLNGLPYSLWQILEHIRITQHDILDFCRSPNYHEPKAEEYWPSTPEPPTADAWDECIASIRRDRSEMNQLALDPRIDLYATIPHGTGQTYLRELLLVADHNAYHVGQLVLIRRLLGIWK